MIKATINNTNFSHISIHLNSICFNYIMGGEKLHFYVSCTKYLKFMGKLAIDDVKENNSNNRIILNHELLAGSSILEKDSTWSMPVNMNSVESLDFVSPVFESLNAKDPKAFKYINYVQSENKPEVKGFAKVASVNYSDYPPFNFSFNTSNGKTHEVSLKIIQNIDNIPKYKKLNQYLPFIESLISNGLYIYVTLH